MVFRGVAVQLAFLLPRRGLALYNQSLFKLASLVQATNIRAFFRTGLIRPMSRRRDKRAIGSGETKPFDVAMEQGAVEADQSQQVSSSPFHPGPTHYVDRRFTCCDCAAKEVWTAEQQKWYYEVAKGSLLAKAVRCRACRDRIKAEKDVQRQQMADAEQRGSDGGRKSSDDNAPA